MQPIALLTPAPIGECQQCVHAQPCVFCTQIRPKGVEQQQKGEEASRQLCTPCLLEKVCIHLGICMWNRKARLPVLSYQNKKPVWSKSTIWRHLTSHFKAYLGLALSLLLLSCFSPLSSSDWCDGQSDHPRRTWKEGGSRGLNKRLGGAGFSSWLS